MLDWDYEKERYRDLLREAEQERLLRQIRQTEREGRPRLSLHARLLQHAGRGLVQVGSRLEAFGTPADACVETVG